MPKRTDIETVLIIGAGPIIIGQACEFDYSGAQACKALKDEGVRVILINSNPATIMTDPSMADVTYIEPIRWQTVAKIIEKERPDALLPTMGGQTALNCALDLETKGVLHKFSVKLIGASADAIDKAENRYRFDQAMKKIGLSTPASGIATSLDQAFDILTRIGFPCIIRPSFTLGGSGGGVAYNREEFKSICRRGLNLSPTSELLIDESLIGWKEFEFEVVRDRCDNCIIVCSIENLDPMGIHTGDSITVAPAQTLSDKEYQVLRNASISILREIGIETGGSNVQFAVNPDDGKVVIIEMNPRVSRSSALASKATGFPIAKIAAKLAIGFTLDELSNEITGNRTPASFEPAIDYVVTKIPRFSFEKFPRTSDRLTTQMKSVGEVMSIGRNFQESLQKALCALEADLSGLNEIQALSGQTAEDALILIRRELAEPGPDRLRYVAEAFRNSQSVDMVYSLSGIDPWFLAQINDLVKEEQHIRSFSKPSAITTSYLSVLKRKGFSDKRIAELLSSSGQPCCEQDVRTYRHALNIHPVFKRVDSCAGEFECTTNYMYSTYDQFCESSPSSRRKIMILGGGPNRIGQGIEFDYCCVHASLAIKEMGFETVMVNCNPETVSTDFDISDRLYFEPVTLEHVLEIVRLENPEGVIIQFGGQTPLKLASSLSQLGVPILGTQAKAIDRAENREQFQAVILKLGLLQPDNATAKTPAEASEKARQLGYPLIVRPSYVLGGRAMEIVYDNTELDRYMHTAVSVSHDCPVLLDSFLGRATEVDVDAICDGSQVVIGAIMQHIEPAGVHSGDSACSLPPHGLTDTVQDKIRTIVTQLALELEVIGLLNVQFAIQDDNIYIIEVNPRASRTVPFVSKCTGRSLAKIAAQVVAGRRLSGPELTQEIVLRHYHVKEPVFPFDKFHGTDPILGPEMRSTGEVMGTGDSFAEAYAKAKLAAAAGLPEKGGTALISVRDQDKPGIIEVAKSLRESDFEIFATSGTAKVLRASGVVVTPVNKVKEGRPHIVDMIVNGKASLVINTTEGRQAIEDSYTIRCSAIAYRAVYTTTLAGAQAIAEAIKFGSERCVRPLQDLHRRYE